MTRTDTAIVTTQPTDLQREAGSILDVISRAARDPSVDVAKLERLLAIQQTLLADQRRTAFAAAMARLQARLPQIAKSGVIRDRDGNTRNHFAKLEDIDTIVRPLLAEEGFSFSYDSAVAAKDTQYTCTVSHRDGHSETRSIVLPRDDGQGRNAVQSSGSTISYARRYLLSMILNLVTRDEDNDGNGPGGPVTAEQAELLRSALAESGGTEARFLNWAAAASFEEIPAANFERSMRFIDEKRRQRRGPLDAPDPVGHK